jgi:hypothetical protein
MNESCSTHWSHEKFVESFGQKTRRKETTWRAQMVGNVEIDLKEIRYGLDPFALG